MALLEKTFAFFAQISLLTDYASCRLRGSLFFDGIYRINRIEPHPVNPVYPVKNFQNFILSLKS